MTYKAPYHALIWTINPNSPNTWRLVLWERCKSDSLDLYIVTGYRSLKLQIKGTIRTKVLDATQYKSIHISLYYHKHHEIRLFSFSIEDFLSLSKFKYEEQFRYH